MNQEEYKVLKYLIRSVIIQWEKYFCRIKKIQPMENSSYDLLNIRKTKYKGETLRLADDCILTKGDCIIEVHLSNIVLAKGKVGNATVASDLQLLPIIRAELFTLGKYLHSREIEASIKAIGGVTIHGPGIRRLGFSLYSGQKNLSNTLAEIWMRILRWAFSRPNEAVRMRNRSPRHLEHFYMPISQFIQKYGSKAT
jgi:hypothetical protein